MPAPSSSPAPVQAAIDVGTNTMLMVTGRRDEDGTVAILDDAHCIARMGQGVDASGRVRPEAIDRVCGFLDEYRRRAESLGARRVRAYGTSALRDATNSDQVVAAAARVGIHLTALSGQDEARHTFVGAGFGLHLPARVGVLDIGGGSTELAVGAGGHVRRSASVDVGAVRITERHFPCLPPTAAQVEEARGMMTTALRGLVPIAPETVLVGVAGTVTTLGALDLGAPSFDSKVINGHFLRTAAVATLAEELLAMSHEEIRALPQVSDQRADVLGAGALVLRTFLESRGLPGLTVSTRGIRYGLLLEMLAGKL